MGSTPRLGLPFLSAGQAQKEFFVNASLQILDTVAAAAVEQLPQNSPPSSPVVGACYIVDTAPTGAWLGKAQCLAAFTSGGWQFIVPAEGLIAYVKSASTWAVFRASAWEVGQVRGSKLILGGLQVVGSQAAAIASASGGTTVDTQARATIDQILTTLRQHGLIAT